jgi:hypothetical protein
LNNAFEFLSPTEELIEVLNMDFRIWPSLLHAVSVLHAGSLVMMDHNVLLALMAKVYSGSKTLDIHSESNQKPIPAKRLSVGAH